MEKRKMNNEGFSLIELIVVIAIMAILVGALAPQLLKYIERSRQAADIQAAGAVYTAVQTAYADPMIADTDKTAANALDGANEFGAAVLATLGGSAPSYTSKAYKNQSTTVTIDANNMVTVSVGVNSGTDGKAFKIDANGQSYVNGGGATPSPTT